MNHRPSDDLRALLARLDDPVYAQFQGGWAHWNEAAAEARFLALVEALEARLGCPVLPEPEPADVEAYRLLWQTSLLYESSRAIQDASFHGQVLLPRSLLTEAGRSLNYVVRLRVSNFGSLATVYDDDTMVQEQVLASMRQTLEEQGYIYVPSDLLAEPYTGKNPGVSGFRNWGLRYFDWI